MTQQRLQNYDEVLDKKRDVIIERMVQHDTQKSAPIDRHPYFIEYAKYCICKIYGLTTSVEENADAYNILVYLYWKTFNISYTEIIKRVGGSKSQHSVRIQKVMQSKDPKTVSILTYLEKKSQEFYKLM